MAVDHGGTFAQRVRLMPIYAGIGAAFGLLFAVFALLVGAIRIAVALVSGVEISFADIAFVVPYVLAFVAGGAISGAAWPWRRWIGGYYGLGVIMMAVVMGV